MLGQQIKAGRTSQYAIGAGSVLSEAGNAKTPAFDTGALRFPWEL